MPDDRRGTRDRVLLLIGFAGALRCSEPAVSSVADVARTNCGHAVTVKGS